MRSKKTTVKVIQDKEKPVKRNVLAQALLEMSKSMSSLRQGGLNRRAIVVLVHAGCGASKYGQKPSRGDVEAVLDSLLDLERRYCK